MAKSKKHANVEVTWVPGWIGGRLTNPAHSSAYLDQVKSRLEKAAASKNSGERSIFCAAQYASSRPGLR